MSTGQGSPLGRGKAQQGAGTRCAGSRLRGRRSRLRCPGVCLSASPAPALGGQSLLCWTPSSQLVCSRGTRGLWGQKGGNRTPPSFSPVCVCVCVCLCVCARKNLGLREEETKFEFRKTRKNKLPLVISGSLFDAHSRFRFFSLLC